MRSLIIILSLLCSVVTASAGTRVWLLRGWGPAIWSRGVDQIGAQARSIPGVSYVAVYAWTDTQRVADEIKRARNSRIVIVGYSCGANSSTVEAAAFNGVRRIDAVIGIQMSTWCGGMPLTPNIGYAQETLNAACLATLGFGCKKFTPGPGFPPSRLTLINRPQSHGAADDDPDTQRDVLGAIAGVARLKTKAPLGVPSGQVNEVTRLLGQRL